MKVVHILANGPPDVNGYAIRTHGLMKGEYLFVGLEGI